MKKMKNGSLSHEARMHLATEGAHEEVERYKENKKKHKKKSGKRSGK